MNTILNKLKGFFPQDTRLRLLLTWIYFNPLSGWLYILRTIYINFRLTGRVLPLRCFVDPRIKLNVIRFKGSKVKLDGLLIVRPDNGQAGCSTIKIGKGAELHIRHKFEIGQGVSISLADNSKLILGGKLESTGSGITCDSKIMVKSFIEIGADCIIAWGCFITDCDWHKITGAEMVKPVVIKENVWISHDVSILKGARISRGCIVGAKSIVSNNFFPENVLIAGSPAKVIKEGVSWER